MNSSLFAVCFLPTWPLHFYLCCDTTGLLFLTLPESHPSFRVQHKVNLQEIPLHFHHALFSQQFGLTSAIDRKNEVQSLLSNFILFGREQLWLKTPSLVHWGVRKAPRAWICGAQKNGRSCLLSAPVRWGDGMVWGGEGEINEIGWHGAAELWRAASLGWGAFQMRASWHSL